MIPQRFALVGGIVMLAIGAIALVPNLSTYPAELPLLNLMTSYGLFLGFIPMNILTKIAFMAFGIWGILASQAKNTSLPASINFSRWMMMAFGALAILGIIPQTSLLGGYWPLFGAHIAVSAIFAVLGAYFGFTLPRKAAIENEKLKRGNIRAA